MNPRVVRSIRTRLAGLPTHQRDAARFCGHQHGLSAHLLPACRPRSAASRGIQREVPLQSKPYSRHTVGAHRSRRKCCQFRTSPLRFGLRRSKCCTWKPLGKPARLRPNAGMACAGRAKIRIPAPMIARQPKAARVRKATLGSTLNRGPSRHATSDPGVLVRNSGPLRGCRHRPRRKRVRTDHDRQPVDRSRGGGRGSGFGR